MNPNNDCAVFLRYLIAAPIAIESLQPPSTKSVLTSLLSGVASITDDYHIDSKQIDAALALLNARF